MKAVGLLLLILVGGGYGVIRWRRLCHRTTMLAAVEGLAAWLEIQIRYTAAPWSVLLADPTLPADCRLLPFWEELVRDVPAMGVAAAWQKALLHPELRALLTDEDMALLGGFGEQLGATDVEGQRAHCALYRARLEVRAAAARQEQAVQGKLWLTLGVAGGLAAAILLM